MGQVCLCLAIALAAGSSFEAIFCRATVGGVSLPAAGSSVFALRHKDAGTLRSYKVTGTLFRR